MLALKSNLKLLIKNSKVLFSLYLKLWWKFFYFKNWWGAKVWRRTTEVLTPMGFKMISGYHPAFELMRTGRYEVEETALFNRLLGEADRFVDIGANIGYFACIALNNKKPIIAVEPQRNNVNALIKNIVVNGWQDNAEVFPVALSDRPGLVSLFGASDHAASLIPGWAGYSPRFSQYVPVSTLDGIIGSRFTNERLLIKIDVEGVEYSVLRGANGLFAREKKPVWIVEVFLDRHHPGGENTEFKRVFQLFWENHYKALTISKKPVEVTTSMLEEWISHRVSEPPGYGFIFIDAEKGVLPFGISQR